MKSLKEVREELATKSKKLHQVFEEAGPDLDFTKVKCLEGDTKAKVEAVQAMNQELEELNTEYKELADIEASSKKVADLDKLLNQPAASILFPGEGAKEKDQKTLGQLIMEHKSELVPGGKPIQLDYDVKTLFQTSAGWAPESVRIPRVELYPLRQLVVADYVPQFPTTQAAVVYMEETTATLSAAEKAEAAAYAESAFALTERTQTVRKITTSLPVTDEQLADVPAAEAYINSRLSYDIRRRLDLQILEGNGSAPNLEGTLNVTGIQSQALGTDPVCDAIYKCFDLIRTDGFAEPSVLFINPADWQPVRLLRTADGLYIFGSPQEAGRDVIWGKPVVQTTAVTANTALTGDYTGFAALYIRSGLEISVGYVNDDFTKGKKTLRADMRCAMVHFRPKAFGKITGI